MEVGKVAMVWMQRKESRESGVWAKDPESAAKKGIVDKRSGEPLKC